MMISYKIYKVYYGRYQTPLKNGCRRELLARAFFFFYTNFTKYIMEGYRLISFN